MHNKIALKTVSIIDKKIFQQLLYIPLKPMQNEPIRL